MRLLPVALVVGALALPAAAAGAEGQLSNPFGGAGGAGGQEETSSTTSAAPAQGAAASSTSNSHTTLFIGVGVAVVLLVGIGCLIVRDARGVAPVSEGPAVRRDSAGRAARFERRRSKAKAARAQRKRNR